MSTMIISIGIEASRYTSDADDQRILDAERKITPAVRNARLARLLEEHANQKPFEIEEGIVYGPGISD